MKPKLKSILILVVTLAIGIAIGAMSWGSIHNKRIERMREVRNQGGLYSSVDRYIDPTDAEQEKAIRDITDRFSRRFGEIYRESGRKLQADMDTFRTALSEVLTQEQQEAIKPLFHRGRRSNDNDRGGGSSSDDEHRDRDDDSSRGRSHR